MKVLALNSGSSSLKFGVFEGDANKAELVCEGEAEEIGREGSRFSLQSKPNGEKQTEDVKIADAAAALEFVFHAFDRHGISKADAVGHRVVHGGKEVRDHALITPQVRANLQGAADFAPLHVPAALRLIDECEKRMGNVPQAACLDTAFHRTMPDFARTFALPKEVRDLGVERYGFHGLSIQSVVDRLHPFPPRTIIAHLGGGCSVTALREGQSVDTTMGLTPTGGIMMGTRSGDLDPGALVFLMRNGYGGADKLENAVDHKSGMAGVSETSSDMRKLRELAKSDSRADLAICMFTYQVKKTVAAMAGVLGGLDALVFTGGIGEHDAKLRNDVVAPLHFLGQFSIITLPSREEQTIAKITAGLCAKDH